MRGDGRGERGEREMRRDDPTNPGDSRRVILSNRLRFALVGVVAILLAGSPFWAPLLMRRVAFFRVRRVEILGARYVEASEILARLHVDTSASVWDPTASLAQRVATHPGIRTVVIRRRLPGTLVVEISERPPVALVPTSAGLRAYDDRGVALPIDLSRVHVDAPIVAQRDTTVMRLIGAIRIGMPALYDRVSAVRRTGRRELVLELKSVAVRTMDDVSLGRLAEIEPVETDLARRQLRPAEIDLRYRDQVIARLP